MNNGSTIEAQEKAVKDGGYKVAVNSIQRTLFVERLYVNIAFPADRIIPYDKDNLYPNKIKSIALRSGTTMSAIETLAAFTSGEGFNGMDMIVNSEGQTLWDILLHIAFQKSMFRGWALHFNYNILSQITEINPINFEFVRWSKDLKRFVVNPDWARRNLRNREVVYNPFNPDNVFAEMQECGGVEKYNGQLYYWIPNKSDYYTVCKWDSVLDDAQFEAEAKLYGLSSIQNDYSLSGLITLPQNLVSKDQIDETKSNLQGDTGASNAGGVRVISAMPAENLSNWKWFTPISRNSIDTLHQNQIETAKFNIYAAFRQPPILNGVDNSGMFNEASFADAFNYYNSSTETDRKEVERELTKILNKSIWANLGAIQIIPKNFITRIDSGAQQQTTQSQPQAALNNTLTNLTGRQLQGIFRIIKRYEKGEINFEQASLLLSTGFGFDEEQVNVWLVNDNIDG